MKVEHFYIRNYCRNLSVKSSFTLSYIISSNWQHCRLGNGKIVVGFKDSLCTFIIPVI